MFGLTMRRTGAGRWALVLGVTLWTGMSVEPKLAQACGGTFCDSGPTAMPVDQSGENILFVLDGAHVEAHVQIQYEGEAERFAWIVPMPKVPEASVGSQILFQNLLVSTSPAYGSFTQFDSCGFGTGGSSSGGSAGSGGSGGGAGAGGTGGAGGGPTVVYRKSVGSFVVVALEGGTAQEVVDWLDANGYQNVDTAPALLDKYVQKGFVFVAVKLAADASTDEIHPLVFRYEGDEPCVPIELTAVAAVEDMGIRAFFLGDDRVVPTNYKHVTFNPVRLDWTQSGANYSQVINRSVDSPVANGHAFVTEYAGRSDVVPTFDVLDPRWNGAPISGTTPETVIDELTNQGLVRCFSSSVCEYYHPLIQPLLTEFLPVPATRTDAEFYSCVSCFVDEVDDTAWDAAAFADAVDERIVKPGQRAVQLLERYPYLTRLFTTMSPAEMTEDPMFHPRTDLPQVDLRSTFATTRIACEGERGSILPPIAVPYRRQVGLDGAQWPLFSSAMPWAERIEEFTPGNPGIVLVDNTQQIDEELARWNESVGWPPPPWDPGSGGTPGFAGAPGVGGTPAAGGSGPGVGGRPGFGGVPSFGGGAGAGGSGAMSAGGSAGADSAGGTTAATASDDDGGCQVRPMSPASGGGAGALLGLAGLLALGRRRQARS